MRSSRLSRKSSDGSEYGSPVTNSTTTSTTANGETAGQAETPARLVILRTSERDIRNRQIFASLDGVSLGDLIFGSRIEREIAPGPHHLRIHNTLFWKNLDLQVAPGEVVTFQTINYAGRGFLNLVLIIGVAPLFLAVERVETNTPPPQPVSR